jgi:iron complex transport system substrate-binding protein
MTSRLLVSVLLLLSSFAVPAIEVVDDTGRLVSLDRPATRIITLAPHLTEMLYAIEQGNRIVATVAYSDYPEQAKRIPRLGSFDNLKLERILSFKPDLVLAWHSGNKKQQLTRLEEFGLTVYRDNPQRVADVARTLRNLGKLTASRTAEKSAVAFEERLALLKQRYRARAPLSVFYQFWDRPMYTVNDQHYITDVFRICKLENVFASLPQLSATVDREAVIKANPDLIIAAVTTGVPTDWFDSWQKWPELKAVKYQNLFTANADWLNRHTPRLLLATEQICQFGDQARKALQQKKAD